MKTLPKFPLLKLQRNAKTFVFRVKFLAPDGKMADCCKELLVIVDKCKTRLFCDIFSGREMLSIIVRVLHDNAGQS